MPFFPILSLFFHRSSIRSLTDSENYDFQNVIGIELDVNINICSRNTKGAKIDATMAIDVELYEENFRENRRRTVTARFSVEFPAIGAAPSRRTATARGRRRRRRFYIERRGVGVVFAGL
ncbi:hypothetical protein GWI33_019184 [Rhynchophorus ferrugineus]|uniref:Uncharacterized protein n=1 Tax=Rhynchophorus ferrugineus TaxID=354439 RepID=A0A834HS85_RHYFE|nr:hypothetical protein GWI33_019184 [Rhynchophorus ferrugineus]